MTHSTLLPEGFYDLLPPDAHRQRQLYLQVLATFESFGYEEVSPPFMEFDRNLLKGNGESLTTQTFRLMDPLSREMMGLRTDMTPQVARIAASRLDNYSKPMRLCYSGTCFHVSGEGLQKNRQYQQAGAELIGSDKVSADCEILRVAAEVLDRTVAAKATVDISLPGLRKALLDACPAKQQDALADAFHHKNRQQIAGLDIPFAEAAASLLENTGTEPDWTRWEKAVDKLPEPAATLLKQWITRCRAIASTTLPMRLSFDPLDSARSSYHCELAFSLFLEGKEEEVGRGGRYLLNDETPAIGFSLYLKRLEGLHKADESPMRCYVLFGNSEEDCQRLREKGWTTLYALEEESEANALETARRNRCTHLLENGHLKPLT